jgi:hypothetical protein
MLLKRMDEEDTWPKKEGNCEWPELGHENVAREF